jgi:hypothetical protein
VSAVNQSAAQTLATPADFAVDTSITSSAFSGGIPMYPSTGGAPLDINFSTTAANGDYITAVSILSDSPDSYLVIYVKNGTKEGWKYWKLDF